MRRPHRGPCPRHHPGVEPRRGHRRARPEAAGAAVQQPPREGALLGAAGRVPGSAPSRSCTSEPDAPPDTLAYPLPPALPPGDYQARWKVMAADGHVTEGAVAFTVAAS